jgi:hypothetical protein
MKKAFQSQKNLQIDQFKVKLNSATQPKKVEERELSQCDHQSQFNTTVDNFSLIDRGSYRAGAELQSARMHLSLKKKRKYT